MDRKENKALRRFIDRLTPEQREDFAAKCGTTWGHLRNVMYGFRPASPVLAVAVERNSDGAVTRKHLCRDWRFIWPEA